MPRDDGDWYFSNVITDEFFNIDDNPALAENYGVSSIPTLMVFKGGDVVERLVGVQPKQRMQDALDAAKG